MKKTIIGKAVAVPVALVFAISMYSGAVLADELGQTEQTVTVPGETPSLHFEFDDDNPATPPVAVSANSIKDVTLKYAWSATNPADVATVIGAATKCAPASRINQLITINLNDAGASLSGSISWQERNSNEEVTGAPFHQFGGGVDEDGGKYTLSLCVR
ncbi:MAG: hypothetical protein M3161_05785 [Actinomycetota bacterium]|nr:hypothetical protein [Actinomycetota bacterium]